MRMFVNQIPVEQIVFVKPKQIPELEIHSLAGCKNYFTNLFFFSVKIVNLIENYNEMICLLPKRCQEGYRGKPPRCRSNSLCDPSPCGPHSVCKEDPVRNYPRCTCKPTYIGTLFVMS